MKFYINEILKEGKTAGFKARDDVNNILNNLGYEPIDVSAQDSSYLNIVKKLYIDLKTRFIWKNAFKNLKCGDEVVIQFPMRFRSIFLKGVFTNLQKRNIKVILLVHDLETCRTAISKDSSLKHRIATRMEETTLLELCSFIIVHNKKMLEEMVKMGYDRKKLISLEVFDYLIPNFDVNKNNINKNLPIIIAGNLHKSKATYAYNLPESIKFNLYGIDYDCKNKDNIDYKGAFPADQLPFKLEGSFGLVWDGKSIETCTGVFGEYLKINNPHKVSLYIASGVPIIIWKQAALAEFIETNNLGITIDNLNDIKTIIDSMSAVEYRVIKENVERFSAKLRNGKFLEKALKQIN